MAYMSQENKASIAPKVKAILKKYGVKGSLSVLHHSTLRLTIKSGRLDFINNVNTVVGSNPRGSMLWTPAKDTISINPYHFKDHFSGNCLKFLTEVMAAMNNGNWDKSDIQSDYFNVGWYVDISVGKWNAPYVLER